MAFLLAVIPATCALSGNAAEKSDSTMSKWAKLASRFHVGGYGEAVYSRNFYSDRYQRYTDPQSAANDKSHGRFDLPHVV